MRHSYSLFVFFGKEEFFTKRIVITNNPMVNDTYSETKNVIFLEKASFVEVLEFARDKIHKGHTLLTHPLSGSIKPNETPYKTLLLTTVVGDLNVDSLTMIEESLQTAYKFNRNAKIKNWTEKILDDFQLIDFGLIKDSVERAF